MQHTESIIEFLTAGQQQYLDKATSYSPFFSDCGLSWNPAGASGITQCHLHHNRATYSLGSADQPFLAVAGPQCPAEGRFDGVTCGATSIIGTTRNTFLISQTDHAAGTLTPLAGLSQRRWCSAEGTDTPTWIWEAFVPAGDQRDPDRYWPVLIAAQLVSGDAICDENGTLHLNGQWSLLLSIHVLDTQHQLALACLRQSATSTAAAQQQVYHWLSQSLNTWRLPPTTHEDHQRARSISPSSNRVVK